MKNMLALLLVFCLLMGGETVRALTALPFQAFPLGTEEDVWLEAMREMDIEVELLQAAYADNPFLTPEPGRHDYTAEHVEYLGLPMEVSFYFEDGVLDGIHACFFSEPVPLVEQDAYYAAEIAKFFDLLEVLTGYGYTQPEDGFILRLSESQQYEYYDYPFEDGHRDWNALTRALCSQVPFSPEGVAIISLTEEYDGLIAGMIRSDWREGDKETTNYTLFVRKCQPEMITHPGKEQMSAFRNVDGVFPAD